MLCRLDGFALNGKLAVDFFSTSELLYPNLKNRFRQIRARPIFYMISDNHNVSLGIFHCSIYTRRNALRDDYHKKVEDMLAYTPVDFNYLKILANIFINLVIQNQFIQKNNFSTMLQSVDLPMQRTQTLHLLARTAKVQSGFNNLMSHKLEYSE